MNTKISSPTPPPSGSNNTCRARMAPAPWPCCPTSAHHRKRRHHRLLVPFGLPPFQEMLHKMMEAGRTDEGAGSVGQTMGMIAAEGFPSMGLNIVKTPSTIWRHLARHQGHSDGYYRRPNDLLAACEAYVPVLIKSIVGASDRIGAPAVLYVLHKGATPSCRGPSSRNSTGRPGNR